MHTILGAGGAVAKALTNELLKQNETIRLVSRRPVNTPGTNISWERADLLKYHDVLKAAKGSRVIYLTAGLVFDRQIWKAQWPVIMDNVIDVATKTGARVVFLDNVYMYGIVEGKMTENTPYNPCSVKGEISAMLATKLMNEAKAGNLKAVIGRAADFYGIESMNSFLDMMVLDKFSKGQKAQWVGNAKKLHSFSYVPDLGKGLAMLGQYTETDSQVWHLPTAKALTGEQLIQLAAQEYTVKPAYSSINRLMLRTFGLFKKVVKESVEMYYQYDRDYYFESTKFENKFNYKPMSYEAGIKGLSKTLYVKK